MTFRSAAELFGDDGAHGAAVPYSTTNPPGTASANRGVQFGEQLTAAIANRPHYALAENTDDLNARLVPFETDGLDAAYRLGLNADAGGGRVVTVDGGAVETQSTLTTALESDRANAHLRANLMGDTIDGGVGLDVVARATSASGSARYGILDRRSLTMATTRTTFSHTQSVTLNKAGAGATRITLEGGGSWQAGGGQRDLTPMLDMVEILGGPHAGLYLLASLVSSTVGTLKHLSGASPSFTSDTATTARLFRPVLTTSAPYSGSGVFSRGVTIAGCPTEDTAEAALTLIGGSKTGLDSDGSDGMRYALRVIGQDTIGGDIDALRITSLGTLLGSATSILASSARQDSGAGFGAPGVLIDHYDTSSDFEVGVVARKPNATAVNYYGVLGLEDAAGTAAFTFPASGTGSGTGIDTGGINMATAPGQLLEIVTPTAQAGIYMVINALGNRVTLRRLNGTAVSGFPTTGSGTFKRFSGAVIGRTQHTAVASDGVLGTNPSTADVSLLVHTPERQAAGSAISDTAIMVQSKDTGAMAIRVVGSRQEGFSLTTGGTARFRSTVYTPLVDATTVQAANVEVATTLTITDAITVDPPIVNGYCSIPTILWGSTMYNNAGTIEQWYKTFGLGGPTWVFSPALSGSEQLWIPLSCAPIPSFAIVTGVRLRYETSGFSGDQLRARLVNVSATTAAITQLETFGNLPAHGGGLANETFAVSGSPRTLNYTATTYIVLEPLNSLSGTWTFVDAAVSHTVDQVSI